MKNLLLLFSLLLSSLSFSQRHISLSIYQDAKFLVAGDKERGYDAGTLDLLMRFEMQGDQQDWGYMIVFPEYEYAELDGTYQRYSANVGYVFNKLIVEDFEAGASIGYGMIDRWRRNFLSFGGSGFIKYKLTDDIKLNLLVQATERKELKWAYGGNNVIKFSGFIGVEFNLN